MYIEVALLPTSTATGDALCNNVLALVHAATSIQTLEEGQTLAFDSDELLKAHVKHVRVFEVDVLVGAQPEVHVHPLFDEEAAEEDAGDGESVAFQLWTLPSLDFDGLWESLIYEEEVQPRLLRYVSTALRFSSAGVDGRVIAWNRVVLLHGPPGTGKTSLCRGLAHKLAVRLSATYAQGHLVEVNAHSLFSKWFSESGKMVMALFARIRELLEDDDAFVCVLVDEVESLAAARSSASSGTEPSDAIRVVNALLTQLDGLKRYANCLVLTTSNLTGAIDAAFIDRADLKQYIGPPGPRARYEILRSCVHELGRVGLVGTPGAPAAALAPISQLTPVLPSPPPSFEQLVALSGEGGAAGAGSGTTRHAMMLYAIATLCENLSGRALRKLPFLAHALFGGGGGGGGGLPLEEYLVALRRAVAHEHDARDAMA